jgi:hypothetical protein
VLPGGKGANEKGGASVIIFQEIFSLQEEVEREWREKQLEPDDDREWGTVRNPRTPVFVYCPQFSPVTAFVTDAVVFVMS